MSFSARAKRVLVGAMAGAMVLSLMPAGIASAGVDEVCENATSPFTDKGTTHADAIDCIYSYGITTGRTATTFGTFEDLTRGQAATLFVNFALVATDGEIADAIDEDIDVPFTDIEGTTHEAGIEILYRLGLIQGTTLTTYSPNDQILRAQFADILFRAHEALGVEFDDEYPNPFTDVDRFSVSALTAEGIFSGTNVPGIFDPWSPVLRGQTASTLALSAGLLDDLGLWLAPRLPAPPVEGGFTDAPELIGVELQREFTNTVRYAFEFDVPVATAGLNPDNFYLTAWDGTTISAISVIRDDDVDDGFTNLENNKVRAVFPKNFGTPNARANSLDYFTHVGQWSLDPATPQATRAPWTAVTTASVAVDAVRLLEDARLFNPEGAVAVQNVTVPGGTTQWPTLVNVTNFDTVGETADFVFDRNLSAAEIASATATGQANSFWLVLTSGTTAAAQDDGLYEVQSSAVSTVPGAANTLRVTFEDDVHSDDYLTGSLVNQVARGYVEAGTFGLPDVPGSPFTDVNVSATGNTQRADLVDYEINYDDDTVLYVFDREVEFVSELGPDSEFREDLFNIVYFNGQTVVGLDGEGERPNEARAREVLIAFPEGSVTEAIVAVGVDVEREDGRIIDASATIDTGNDTFTEPRQLPVSQSFAGLETLAPNLLEVEVIDLEEAPATGEVIAREVIYTFDRELEIVGNATFALYAEDGARVTATATQANVTVDNDAFTVVFDAPGNFSLAGAGDAVIGAVVFGNGAIRNDPANDDLGGFSEATAAPSYSLNWITNYGTSVPVVVSSAL